MTEKRLSKKQKLFVEHYLQCWNATQAAKDAGYAEKSASVTGYNNIRKPSIAAEIKKRIDEVVMSADEALSLLSDQARASLTDIGNVDEDGRFTFDFAKAKKNGKLHLIKSMTPAAYGTKIELHNAQRALELIGKAYGLFIDKQEVKVDEAKVAIYLPDNKRD